MPRAPRIEYAGALYHVMSRGNRGEDIFAHEADRQMLLATLASACERTGWRVHAYVLMPNHSHLLVETPEPNLVAGMKWLLGTYTQRFNARHQLRGHLFQGRYKTVMVDEGEDGVTVRVSDYIHLNPARAGLLSKEKGASLRDYRWSSYPLYLSPRDRPPWLEVERVFGGLGLTDDRRGRRAYEEYVEGWVREGATSAGAKKQEEEWKGIRRGWCLGGEVFREKLLDRLGGLLPSCKKGSLAGGAVIEHGEREAERLLTDGLKRLGLSRDDLGGLRKMDGRKVALAEWISGKTVVGQEWLVEKLRMGSRASVACGLYRGRRGRIRDLARWQRKLA